MLTSPLVGSNAATLCPPARGGPGTSGPDQRGHGAGVVVVFRALNTVEAVLAATLVVAIIVAGAPARVVIATVIATVVVTGVLLLAV